MDASQMARLWQRRATRYNTAIEGGLVRAAGLIQAISRLQMNRLIYAHPPDVNAAGSPKWKQTRTLYEGELARPDPMNHAVILTNEVIYAHARHELGRDGRKTKRVAHWREAAERLIHAQFDQVIEAALRSLWEGH